MAESPASNSAYFTWIGSQNPHLDQLQIARHGPLFLGSFGGSKRAGAVKNEDGAFLCYDPQGDWEFVMLLDAHNTAQSAELLVKTIEIELPALKKILAWPVGKALPALQNHLVSRFQSPAFRTRSQYTQGEAACLISVRKDRFLWWLSIGDCCLYLLHPDLARLGQYALNQRNYYEWIGQVSTFSLPISCYSSGIRELRFGPNHIVLCTDGLLEFGDRFYENPENVFKDFTRWEGQLDLSIKTALERVYSQGGIDSATIVAWQYHNPESGMMPSRPPRTEPSRE